MDTEFSLAEWTSQYCFQPGQYFGVIPYLNTKTFNTCLILLYLSRIKDTCSELPKLNEIMC